MGPTNAFDLEQIPASGGMDEFDAWPENWHAVALFIALRTQ